MDLPRIVRAPSDNGIERTDYSYDGLDRLIHRTDPKGTLPASDATTNAQASPPPSSSTRLASAWPRSATRRTRIPRG